MYVEVLHPTNISILYLPSKIDYTLKLQTISVCPSDRVSKKTMPEIVSYLLPPTRLIPNSPYPLIHYANHFTDSKSLQAATIHDLFARNGWQTQWIFRYGPTQPSHYHSATHECMAVLSGSATIRFGAADSNNTKADNDVESSHDDGKETGAGIELRAHAGDVFLIPAGVSHKTFDPQPPTSTFALLTPGNGHGIIPVAADGTSEDARQILADVQLSGFTMLGAYPANNGIWDFAEGGDHVGGFDRVWAVPKPGLDPVVGEGGEGMCGLWGQ